MTLRSIKVREFAALHRKTESLGRGKDKNGMDECGENLSLLALISVTICIIAKLSP
jgi:hypothetical protein